MLDWKKKIRLGISLFNGIDTTGMLPKSAFSTKLEAMHTQADGRIKNRAPKGYKEKDEL